MRKMAGRWRWMVLAAVSTLALAVGCSDDAPADQASNRADGGDVTDAEAEDGKESNGTRDGGDQGSDDDDADAGPGALDASDASDGGSFDGGEGDGSQDGGGGGDGGDAGGEDAADAGPEADVAEDDCAYPPLDDSCPDGEHGPGSFIDSFVVAQSGQCCRDFDGDGSDDSAVGDVAETAGSFIGVDFNDMIDDQIKDGALVYLFEYADWRDEQDDPSLDTWLYFGSDTDNDFQDNLDGDGDFYIEPESLDDSGDPRSDLSSASVSGGHYSMPGGSAPLMLPAGAELAEVEVEDIQIEADVVAGADLEAHGRVELENGELSGYVTLEEIFGALNQVARECGCFNTDPVFTEASQDSWQCNSTQSDKNACQGQGDACEFLSDPTQCSFGAQFINNEADVDSNNDNSDDALSLGVEFEAVGASIQGVAP